MTRLRVIRDGIDNRMSDPSPPTEKSAITVPAGVNHCEITGIEPQANGKTQLTLSYTDAWLERGIYSAVYVAGATRINGSYLLYG